MLGPSSGLQSPILADQEPADNPRTGNRHQCKACRCAEPDAVPRLVALGPQVRAVDITDLAADVGHGEHDGLLLARLRERRRRPADNDRVDRVRADGKDEARNVACRDVEGRGCDDEADDGGRETRGDVPCTLVQTAGAPAAENTGRAGDDERRASEH